MDTRLRINGRTYGFAVDKRTTLPETLRNHQYGDPPVVELRGIEPLTSSLRTTRSPS